MRDFIIIALVFSLAGYFILSRCETGRIKILEDNVEVTTLPYPSNVKFLGENKEHLKSKVLKLLPINTTLEYECIASGKSNFAYKIKLDDGSFGYVTYSNKILEME